MTRIVAPIAEQLRFVPAGDLVLERVSPNESVYAAIWSRHYTGSRGAIGRQLHYLVSHKGRVVGLIAAGEPMFRCAPRDRWFGLSHEPGRPPPAGLVACSAFRIEDAPQGLASRVIAAWRERVAVDWPAPVIGWETLVGLPRWGCCFRRDRWRKVGYTAGRGARRPAGHGHAKRLIVDVEPKLILCRSKP